MDPYRADAVPGPFQRGSRGQQRADVPPANDRDVHAPLPAAASDNILQSHRGHFQPAAPGRVIVSDTVRSRADPRQGEGLCHPMAEVRGGRVGTCRFAVLFSQMATIPDTVFDRCAVFLLDGNMTTIDAGQMDLPQAPATCSLRGGLMDIRAGRDGSTATGPGPQRFRCSDAVRAVRVLKDCPTKNGRCQQSKRSCRSSRARCRGLQAMSGGQPSEGPRVYLYGITR